MTLKSQTLALFTPTIQRGDSHRCHRACCAACHKGVYEGSLAGELGDSELVQVCKQREVDDGEGNVPAEEKDTHWAALSTASQDPWGVADGRNTPICQRGSSSPVQLLPTPTNTPSTCNLLRNQLQFQREAI